MSSVSSSSRGGAAWGALQRPSEYYHHFGPTLNELSFGLLGWSFQPQRDIIDLSEKVILVTGGNTGLGKETIVQLAQHNPARIYLAARNEIKARDAIVSIREQIPSAVDIRYLPLDLGSLESVRAAAELFRADCDRLDTLILNAGTMNNPTKFTEDGFELHMGTNHVGHFLLTTLLLSSMQKTVALSPDVRVVSLSSAANVGSPPLEIMTSASALAEHHGLVRYSASKAANILFASELARRYPEILSVSVHPGAVASELYEHTMKLNPVVRLGLGVIKGAFCRSLRTGALNQLWAAGVKRESLVNGAYYVPIGVHASGNPYANDADMGRRLWEWTEQQIAERS
ncbi:putative short-chain dehydrogenase/reductase family protein [Aspergillus homomorphus CBS 101889]|uniref:Short-chain dehydrogenase/reductase family protein n=1 Tax=Aspergillus homomorphus (strain CBS 101889) TaxID=1450537 RepID=A0A395HW34_ASPHC|nr:short-chain dehydrogenase/reductase family protein [Aspergillus homomorphus CBS 101889]RAL11048.1 short-chain dehydrogenase/reductase family protein [Aspergillus homomorphus CBS 101889]